MKADPILGDLLTSRRIIFFENELHEPDDFLQIGAAHRHRIVSGV